MFYYLIVLILSLNQKYNIYNEACVQLKHKCQSQHHEGRMSNLKNPLFTNNHKIYLPN